MNAPHPFPVMMVADVTGSASLHQRLDEQEAERAIERCIKRMTRSIEAGGGHLLQVAGDELLASFASAEEACHAAIDMQQRIADLPPVSGHTLCIRVALHENDSRVVDQMASPLKLATLMRIASLAEGTQILCSTQVADTLAHSLAIRTAPKQELGKLQEDDNTIELIQVLWSANASNSQSRQSGESERRKNSLRLLYRGKTFRIDEKSPVLTLGRDTTCSLMIDDRKVSRTHARIEQRADGFYLVDTSTNGSFLSMLDGQEILVRRYEVLLAGSGLICFGSSANDPAAARLEFEHYLK
ncbi:adenylate/guanylate cyclase domain-containing protein [Azonexus sp.]|uniref:adenylate/guanylate cyclase domain-containing protein n=1 Tax=Azonexus sp. TaxID=1872668 RepID=UPI0027B8FB16|nr:adenylate/guanylate cyclase domain-containing protein [Azonexus sp.]